MTDAAAIIERLHDDAIKIVDLRFTDLGGRWRQVALEAATIGRETLEEGVFIDGSSVGGWREVTEADLLIRPDPASAWIDPFAAQATMILVCDGTEPTTGLGYERDPRSAALRAETYLARSTTADRFKVAAELEFFLFDGINTEHAPSRQSGAIALTEPGAGASGAVPAFLAVAPDDPFPDLRAEIVTILAGLGCAGLGHAHGRAPGQNQLRLAADGLVATADRLQQVRYCTHMVAASYGKTASFLPRPVAGGAGAGLVLQQSLWLGDKPVFAGQGYADLSPTCLAFMAGLMAHARALNAFTNPSSNSYRRLRPGHDEPALVAYAAHNRSAALRIPYARRPEAKRIEARFPDPTANPYLALTALLMAGLDGIERKLEPGEPIDRNLYDLPPPATDGLPRLCRSLDEALDALEADHEFLMRGEVMPQELIEAFIRLKRQEADLVARTPHPLELTLYRGF